MLHVHRTTAVNSLCCGFFQHLSKTDISYLIHVVIIVMHLVLCVLCVLYRTATANCLFNGFFQHLSITNLSHCHLFSYQYHVLICRMATASSLCSGFFQHASITSACSSVDTDFKNQLEKNCEESYINTGLPESVLFSMLAFTDLCGYIATVDVSATTMCNTQVSLLVLCDFLIINILERLIL